MIAHWMRVGFVHGVMNTDNMSILGLTIDYGPYGWIDNFDLDWTPNTTDAQGRRYRFGHQPQIAHWNLGQLANALVPAFASTEPLYAGLQRYVDTYTSADRANTAAKLGLAECRDEDVTLASDLYALLQAAEVDMTLFFRALADVDANAPTLAPLEGAFYDDAKRRESEARFNDWLARYAARLRHDTLPRGRAPRAHECGESALRAAQLSRAAGDRPRGARRLQRDPRVTRRDATSVRRPAGTRTLRAAASRLGARARGLLDAFLQLVNGRSRASARSGRRSIRSRGPTTHNSGARCAADRSHSRASSRTPASWNSFSAVSQHLPSCASRFPSADAAWYSASMSCASFFVPRRSFGPGWPGIIRSQSIVSTCLMNASVSSG